MAKPITGDNPVAYVLVVKAIRKAHPELTLEEAKAIFFTAFEEISAV